MSSTVKHQRGSKDVLLLKDRVVDLDPHTHAAFKTCTEFRTIW